MTIFKNNALSQQWHYRAFESRISGLDLIGTDSDSSPMCLYNRCKKKNGSQIF